MSRGFWAGVCIAAAVFVAWCTLLVLDVVHLDGKGEKRQPGYLERIEKKQPGRPERIEKRQPERIEKIEKMTEEERDREIWERVQRREKRWEKWNKQDERR